MRILALLICVLFSVIKLEAQDIHFSQYQYSPLTLNPAQTGNFNGNWRFSNNYRNQWSAVGIPYQTISAGFDKPFRTKKGNIAIGLMFVNDRSGSSRLMTNKLCISLAYIVKLTDGHFIGIGAQGAYAVQAFSIGNLTFPVQWNELTGHYDTNLPNEVSQWDENISYPDLSLGVHYRGESGNIKPYAGVSLYHINKPQISFLREDNRMDMRLTGYGGITIPLKSKVYVQPNLLCMYQKKASDYIAGIEIGYIFPEKSIIEQAYLGGGFRTSFSSYDAAIVSGGIGLYHFLIGLSYDINVSRLATVSNMRGAFEISIIYKDITKTLHQITLPCDRY